MTDLLYMHPNHTLEHQTTIAEIPEPTILILPETIFYAQGGGQPCDQGVIISQDQSAEFRVDKVQNIDGIVHHIGEVIKGSFTSGQTVILHVNKERRDLNTKLHSAGHLLDLAVKELGLNWIPGKGYHFPDSPYVEYLTSLEPAEIEELKSRLEETSNKLIQQDLPVTIEFMDRAEMEKRLDYVPDYLPTNRPSRVVFMGDVGIPCGGTHVQSLKEIGGITITKMKMKSGNLRVGYQLV